MAVNCPRCGIRLYKRFLIRPDVLGPLPDPLSRHEEARMGGRTGSRIALCLALTLPLAGRLGAETASSAPESPAPQGEQADQPPPSARQQFLDQVRAQRQAQAESRRAAEEQRRQRRDAMTQHAESERAAIELQRRAWPPGLPPTPGWAPPAAPGPTAAPQEGAVPIWGGPWWSLPDTHPSGWSNPWYYRGW
jgi:hypothetical protein